MNILHNFQTGNPEGLAPETPFSSPDDFYEHADPILREVSAQVFEEVVPSLEEHEGKWHPLSFMAYRLGTVAGLGTLRLHVWPAGLRHGSPRGPKIHDHAWHLASLVTLGEYTDTIYEVDEVEDKVHSEEERKQRGLLRVYSPRFSAAITTAALRTDGTCARITPVEDRRFSAGNGHTIDAGVFHLTDIPDDMATSTVLIESPTYNASPRILMDTPADPLTNPKHIVTPDEAVYAKEQLI